MRPRYASFALALVLAAPVFANAQMTASRSIQTTGARDRARAPYDVGLENMHAEAWDDAVKSFRSAIEIDPTFEMAFYMLGRAHMGQKKYVEAIGAYERCRDLYRAQVGRQFSNAQERQRDRETRLREIDEVIRSYQASPQTLQMQDAIRQLQNQRRELDEALKRGNTTMTLETSVPAYVSTSLGSAYFRSGRLQDAEREYKAAIAADAKAGEAYSNLAVVYMETGRLDDAERSVKLAEKVGFKVHPQLKQDIKDRKKAGTI
jgi:tetratricopeptide (TPR) repeat protein